MTRSRQTVFHAFEPAPGPEWPIRIDFLGRESRREQVSFHSAGEVITLPPSPLGTLVHALEVGLPPENFPVALWPTKPVTTSFSAILDGLFAEPGHREDPEDYRPRPPLAVIFAHAPWERIAQRRGVVATDRFDRIRYQGLVKEREGALDRLSEAEDRGRRTSLWEVDKQRWKTALQTAAPEDRGILHGLIRAAEEMVARRNLDSNEHGRLLRMIRAPDDYWRRRTRIVAPWLAKDVEAGAWVELIYAVETGATVRRCQICDTAFLRPRAYPGRLCLTCREVNWRQQSRLRRVHPMFRVAVAVAVVKANRAGRPFPLKVWEGLGSDVPAVERPDRYARKARKKRREGRT